MPSVNNLRSKLRWIPNLNLVPFIFGIAITVTEIQIWKLASAGITDERPIYQSMLISDRRMKAVVAIIHCASVLKYYITTHLIFPGSGLAFNVWHKRVGDKSIKLSENTVSVQYDNIKEYNKMLSFYTLTIGVRHIEHRAFSNSCNATNQRFSLQPLGVNRLPYKVQDFLNVLICVAIALHDLHNLVFCHTDLQWSNIVWVRGDTWCVIDCTNFVRLDASLEDRTFASSRCRQECRFNEFPYSIEHDLFQVGKLAECCSGIHNDELRALTNKCLNRDNDSANGLLQDLQDLQNALLNR